MRNPLEAALPTGENPRRHARELARMREATITGVVDQQHPRSVIAESWHRMGRLGVDPDRGKLAPVMPAEEVEFRRQDSGLAEVLPILRNGLVRLAEESGHIMVVADRDGQILWRDGSRVVLHRADQLGFRVGANWHENVVGTNAIGTALVAQRAVQVFSAEHYVRTHHVWTCAAAPLRSPRDGRVIGVVDISGPAATINATTLALVDAVAQLAETQLRLRHLVELERLRRLALPALVRLDGTALAVDTDGWVAASTGLVTMDRIALPSSVAAGNIWLPGYGTCRVEPLPGGWIVRIEGRHADAAPTSIVLDLTGPDAELQISGPDTTWCHGLTPRHAEICYLLFRHPTGRSARQLALDLFGDSGRVGTVRAEMSRLRHSFSGIIRSRPYRLADGLQTRLLLPPAPEQLLPFSTAPAIRGAHLPR
ncbi:GAF domain-containing protein [Flexivirga oryzae]|uniref:GAF domain-containing protein n=1 Tax=Flexivirga oryzae TaxID=1794944 RepID=A0A839N2F6_9MICO|nr:hypothetical protein [Flexivirga oryzae]